MEPVITKEGFEILQNPDVSRSLLSAYYESLGFHVVKMAEVCSPISAVAAIGGDIKK